MIARVKEIDKRIQKADRLIFISAVENGADSLVTLDANLVNNRILEKEFGIKIRHPKDLI